MTKIIVFTIKIFSGKATLSLTFLSVRPSNSLSVRNALGKYELLSPLFDRRLIHTNENLLYYSLVRRSVDLPLKIYNGNGFYPKKEDNFRYDFADFCPYSLLLSWFV